MGKYDAYKKVWYEKKKQSAGKFCECGKQITWRSRSGKCQSCVAKERSKLLPPPNRKGKQSHLIGNKFKLGIPPWNAGKSRPEMQGENHPNWKGGVTLENEKARKSLECKLWHDAVFRRDNYTCQKCGQVGGYLEADHIKEWADYPELRYEVSNGQTLCLKCHKEKSSEYMKRNNYAKR